MKKEIRPLSIQIELQFPREDWGDASKRLRELGIDVPVELPLVDFIDFTANSMPAMPASRDRSQLLARIRVRVIKN